MNLIRIILSLSGVWHRGGLLERGGPLEPCCGGLLVICVIGSVIGMIPLGKQRWQSCKLKQ